ncbi:MAG: DUF4265 domain-containing protein [Planctomycetota bacterium]
MPPDLVKVHFDAEPDYVEMLRIGGEFVWAEPVAENRFRLDNTPFYVLWARFKDVVEAEPTDRSIETPGGPVPVFEARVLIERSGHATYHVIPYAEHAGAWAELWPRLETLGCTFESTGDDVHVELFAIDAPPEADRDAIDAVLTEYESADRIAWASSGGG